MQKTRNLCVMMMALALMSGCSTVKEISNSMIDGVSGIFESSPDSPMKAMSDCPHVEAVDELSTLSQFANPATPSDTSLVSWAEITDVKSACVFDQDSVAMQLDITVNGSLGPKARTHPQDQPNFAYPYFVAVTNSDGTIVAKEIFSAQIGYGINQNELRQIETINQNLPGTRDAQNRPYSILVGFQLSDQQLAYNRGQLWQPLR